jgi:hypothetical protein
MKPVSLPNVQAGFSSCVGNLANTSFSTVFSSRANIGPSHKFSCVRPRESRHNRSNPGFLAATPSSSSNPPPCNTIADGHGRLSGQNSANLLELSQEKANVSTTVQSMPAPAPNSPTSTPAVVKILVTSSNLALPPVATVPMNKASQWRRTTNSLASFRRSIKKAPVVTVSNASVGAALSTNHTLSSAEAPDAAIALTASTANSTTPARYGFVGFITMFLSPRLEALSAYTEARFEANPDIRHQSESPDPSLG